MRDLSSEIEASKVTARDLSSGKTASNLKKVSGIVSLREMESFFNFG